MPKELEGLFADIAKEGEKVDFTPSESQPEKEVEEEKQEPPEEPKQEEPKEEDKPLPFHKHPRFSRLTKENEELKSEISEMRQVLEQIKNAQQANQNPQQDTVPQEFTHLFGEDVEAYKAFSKMTEAQATAIAQKIVEDKWSQAERQKQEAAESEKQFVQWAENVFLEMEEETGIRFSDRNNDTRNRVLELCEKYGIMGADGNYNFRAAYDLYKTMHQDSSMEERKKLASLTAPSKGEPIKETDKITPSKLSKMSLNSFFK